MSRRVAILAVTWLSVGLVGAVQCAAGVATQNATLARGVFGSDMWEVSTHRPEVGSDARRRPCLDALIGKRIVTGYEASKFEVCGAVAPVPTLINYSIGKGRRHRTVIAMAFGVSVRKVMVDLGSRGKRAMRPRLLSAATAKELGLAQFRFAVIALAGLNCLHRVLATKGNGAIVIDQEFPNCAE